MTNDLVTTKRNSIITAGHVLARANSFPGLSEARGALPRTILIGRLLAGAGDADLLMGTMLCLPRSETYAIALFGDPAGPSFKTHSEPMRTRFNLDDPGAVGAFIDWRLSLEWTPVIASFDPSCASALIQTVELLTGEFGIPIDVVFMATRDEGTPGLVSSLRQIMNKVIIVRPSTISSRFDPSEDLELPALPRILAGDYALAEKPLRDLVATLQPGSQATFLSSLRQFASKLEGMLDE